MTKLQFPESATVVLGSICDALVELSNIVEAVVPDEVPPQYRAVASIGMILGAWEGAFEHGSEIAGIDHRKVREDVVEPFKEIFIQARKRARAARMAANAPAAGNA